jgi:hypothetical protein
MNIVQKKIDGSVFEEWTDPNSESPFLYQSQPMLYCHPNLEEPPKYN